MQYFVVFSFVIVFSLNAEAISVSKYTEERNKIMELEDTSYLGSDLPLTTQETFANDFLMKHKVKYL